MSSSRKCWRADGSPVRSSSQSRTPFAMTRLRPLDLQSDQQLTALYARHITIQRTRRGASQNFSVQAECRGMTGTLEGSLVVLPMVNTAQVRTLGAESDRALGAVLHHPGGGLFL